MVTFASASSTAQSIYNSFSGVATTSTYTQVSPGEYNPTTGTVTNTTSTQTVAIVFTSVNRKQDSYDNVSPSDVVALIPKANLNYTIQIGDTITRGTSVYIIKDWNLVGADSLYKILCERKD